MSSPSSIEDQHAEHSEHVMPHYQLAKTHTDCNCFSDTRCQLALAFQQAREYWAAHPDDEEHAPNEIHQSIEDWLIAKNILSGPTVTRAKPAPRSGQQETIVGRAGHSYDRPSPAKLALPLINTFSFLRRLSLPAMDTDSTSSVSSRATSLPSNSSSLKDLKTLSRSASCPPDQASFGTLPLLKTPKKAWRTIANVFKPRKSVSSDLESIHEESLAELETVVADEDDLSGPIYPATTRKRAMSIRSGETNYMDAVQGDMHDDTSPTTSATPLSQRPCESPVSSARSPTPTEKTKIPTQPRSRSPAIIKSTSPARSTSTSPKPQPQPGSPSPRWPSSPVDPAYQAVIPLLHELETLTAKPGRSSTWAEFQDEGYAKFWETFARLSPREILYAVYAIREGALDHLDVRFEADPAHPAATVFFAVWALAASVLAGYLYVRGH